MNIKIRKKKEFNCKGVAECGNCTNTHNFFFSLRLDPHPTPLIRYNFPTIHVFSQFLHKKRSFSIHSEIVMLHFVPVESMMTLIILL